MEILAATDALRNSPFAKQLDNVLFIRFCDGAFLFYTVGLVYRVTNDAVNIAGLSDGATPTPQELKRTLAWARQQRVIGRMGLEQVRRYARDYKEAVVKHCKAKGLRIPAMDVEKLAR